MMCILGCVCFWLVQKNIHKEQQTKTEEKSIYKTLSESDKKAADIYAELYEESAENVSRIYQKTNDWATPSPPCLFKSNSWKKSFLQSMKI